MISKVCLTILTACLKNNKTTKQTNEKQAQQKETQQQFASKVDCNCIFPHEMQIILFVNIAICIERNCITKLSK
jgi:hypothetical protein